VLGGEDEPAHPGGRERGGPLVRIEVRRVEQARILLAGAPLAPGHRVHAEMDEPVQLQLLPRVLAMAGADVGEVVEIDHAVVIRAVGAGRAGAVPAGSRSGPVGVGPPRNRHTAGGAGQDRLGYLGPHARGAVMTSLTGLWKERRREVTALALSGGGSRADFQLGALRYLYDRVGITPQVITGTSAGSILAATLAQSADHDEQRRYLRELETRWAQMRDSSDMFTPHPWFDRLRRRGPEWMAALQKRQHRQSPLGRTFARAATAPRAGVDGTAGSRATSGPFARGGPLDPAAVAERLRTMTAGRPWPPPREDHGETGGTIGVIEFLTALREVGRARPDLELILR